MLARSRTESYSVDPSGGACHTVLPTPSPGDSVLANGASLSWLWGDGTALQGRNPAGTGTAFTHSARYLSSGPGTGAAVHNPSASAHHAGPHHLLRDHQLPARPTAQARQQGADSLQQLPQAHFPYKRGPRPANPRSFQGCNPRHSRRPRGLPRDDLLAGPLHHLQQAHHHGPALPPRRPGPGGWYNFRVPACCMFPTTDPR